MAVVIGMITATGIQSVYADSWKKMPDVQDTVEIEVTPTPTPTPTSSLGPAVTMRATHYGESYNGSKLGCEGAGLYSSDNPTIAAVGPQESPQWPCGTQLLISSPIGSIVVTRIDSCPGCDDHGSPHMIDLSESGHRAVCGVGTCEVTVQRMER